MRAIYNTLSDPSLHLLAIAMLLVFLAFGGSGKSPAESPLAYCKKCHAHYLPEMTCECGNPRRIAHASR